MKLTKPLEAEDMETINASYDSHKDWKMDPAGYFLIRIHEGKLEAGFCKNDNVILKKFVGTTAEEVCYTIVKSGITDNLMHAAYLGKELEKAEMVMKLGIAYEQDAPLAIDKKT